MERFDWLLSDRRWWRKWRGGHWERWYIGDYWTVWMQNPHGERPAFSHGQPVCEEW